MRLESGRIVIDDPYLVEFFSRRGTLALFYTCEQLLVNACDICEKNSEATSELCMSQLEVMRNDIIEAVRLQKQKPDLTELKECVQASHDEITSKIDSFSLLRNTNRFKGEEGEQIILDILHKSFNHHDGYSIHDTSSKAHSCDMVIQRTGFPDIRIESKAYGRDSGDNVKEAEVKKFISDLIKTNSHGVMVSLYSGIANKGDVDFELVPTTNKFAFYVSSNCQLVPEIVRLVYKLDRMYKVSEQDDVTVLTNDSVVRIREHIGDFTRKMSEIKSHLDNSIRLLGEMMMDKIERLIVALPPEEENNTCQWCGFVAKRKNNLTQHQKKCKKSPDMETN